MVSYATGWNTQTDSECVSPHIRFHNIHFQHTITGSSDVLIISWTAPIINADNVDYYLVEIQLYSQRQGGTEMQLDNIKVVNLVPVDPDGEQRLLVRSGLLGMKLVIE